MTFIIILTGDAPYYSTLEYNFLNIEWISLYTVIIRTQERSRIYASYIYDDNFY